MKTKSVGVLVLCSALVAAPSLPAAGAGHSAAGPLPPDTIRNWIQQMKEQPRGPFSGVRWFCRDGAVLEPTAFACEARGGGFQHGQWSERTQQIRAAGYPIATILADLKPEAVAGHGADRELLPGILLEKFLIAADDGWILRKARYYRGALQDYNERDGAKAILLALLGPPEPSNVPPPSFALLRESARLLPHGAETAAITTLRSMAATIAEQDPRFQNLRGKIHSTPETGDAQRVRQYAASADGRPELHEDYMQLALMIDRAYAREALPDALDALARETLKPELTQRLHQLSATLAATGDSDGRVRLGTEALVLIRQRFAELGPAKVRLAALDASLSAESAVFAASRELLQSLPRATRAQRLEWLGVAARSVYGMGLFNSRELTEIDRSIAVLSPREVRLDVYRDGLQDLGRAATWPGRRLHFDFGGAVEQFTPIEPLAAGFIADRLRGSMMLFYSNVLESLAEDANRLSETRHSLFGQDASPGLRRLNPGLARGVLRTAADAAGSDSAVAIYLVPETTADLPAVAGILTAEEGNALSHVQLLARNLGIPNIVVGRPLMPILQSHRGRSIVVAASAGGVVRIEEDGPAWDSLLGTARGMAAAPSANTIYVNLAKLELMRTGLVSTGRLRAADSGRISGPKAAQVGELNHHFPRHVSPGLTIPFGAYRAVLDRPVGRGQASMFEWLKTQYAELAVRKNLDPEYYRRRVPEVLAFVRNWLQSEELGATFRERLRGDMHDRFGMDGTYGVFVRSDTNVEDLPGFTGAGLNLTVPNVRGLEAVVSAIQQVWASPFSERAFGWRQGLMDQPEHVYASVLLHRSVPNEKSGVLVTANLDTGNRDEITVVTGSGIGGGVDGQAAETLRISLRTGQARLLASDTARSKRVLAAEGGVRIVPSDAPEYVLQPEEIRQLVEFIRAFPQNYPGLRDASGQPAPADIEFGFVGGQLMLLQIRPFLQNAQASRNQYLIDLDAGLRKTGGKTVDLRGVPTMPQGGPA